MSKAFALVTALMLVAARAAAQDVPAATVVLFDAICLTCHEGECSGRMALRTSRANQGMAGHVAGYAGPQDDTTVEHLKALMNSLKTQCRLPAPPVPIPAGGIWRPADLSRVTMADRSRMFVPLGRKGTGPQSVTLAVDPPQRLRVQVVADSFDILFEQDMDVAATGTRVGWQNEEDGQYFLRVIGQKPIGAASLRP